jgi:hypothetical protein
MSLVAMPTSPTSAQVEITGVKPGEKLIFIAHAESDGYSSQIEVRPVQEVGADGRMVLQIQSMGLFQVVHSRGVACAQVTLP